MRWRTIKKPLVVVSRGMMRFNNEDERLANASFLFFFFFSLELVRPRGVVVVQFVQFLFKYRGFGVSFLSFRMPAVGGSRCAQKWKNTHERSFHQNFGGGKRRFLCFLIRKNESLRALFLVVLQERERESGQKTLIKSLEERKQSCWLNAQNATRRDDEKEEKEEEETEDKKVPEVPLKFSSSPSLQNHHY